ncbi:hypothetical protein BD408DRAFT_447245 [Parasitella parasitica]|nr:hypothetical protein BD408DRAFT_447245 [Parasitella parasitica]
MQVSPTLKPINFVNSNKKRSRASIDDNFESHYLKKRLISTIPNLIPSATSINDDNCNRSFPPNLQGSVGGNVAVSAEEEDAESNYQAQIDDKASSYNRVFLMDVNGTLLPMEKKSGETKYSIPEFVLSDTNNKPLQPSSGQLILYEKNRMLAYNDKEQLKYQRMDDNDSVTSEENDEEYDLMDLD